MRKGEKAGFKGVAGIFVALEPAQQIIPRSREAYKTTWLGQETVSFGKRYYEDTALMWGA